MWSKNWWHLCCKIISHPPIIYSCQQRRNVITSPFNVTHWLTDKHVCAERFILPLFPLLVLFLYLESFYFALVKQILAKWLNMQLFFDSCLKQFQTSRLLHRVGMCGNTNNYMSILSTLLYLYHSCSQLYVYVYYIMYCMRFKFVDSNRPKSDRNGNNAERIKVHF